MATTLKTSFGIFAGKQGDAVTQYLGIKYASLENQLAVPKLMTSYGDNVVDASAFGSASPLLDLFCWLCPSHSNHNT